MPLPPPQNARDKYGFDSEKYGLTDSQASDIATVFSGAASARVQRLLPAPRRPLAPRPSPCAPLSAPAPAPETRPAPIPHKPISSTTFKPPEFDANDDGRLELSELRRLCGVVGRELSDPEIKEGIRLLGSRDGSHIYFTDFAGARARCRAPFCNVCRALACVAAGWGGAGSRRRLQFVPGRAAFAAALRSEVVRRSAGRPGLAAAAPRIGHPASPPLVHAAAALRRVVPGHPAVAAHWQPARRRRQVTRRAAALRTSRLGPSGPLLVGAAPAGAGRKGWRHPERVLETCGAAHMRAALGAARRTDAQRGTWRR